MSCCITLIFFGYVVCKYFLLVCSFPFYPLNRVFHRIKFLILMKSNLSIWFLWLVLFILRSILWPKAEVNRVFSVKGQRGNNFGVRPYTLYGSTNSHVCAPITLYLQKQTMGPLGLWVIIGWLQSRVWSCLGKWFMYS